MGGGDYSTQPPAALRTCLNTDLGIRADWTRIGPMSATQVTQTLQLVFFLRGLSEAEYADLAERLPLAEFAPGDILLNLGDPLQSVYVILDGEIELAGYDANGEPVHRGNLTAGSVAGLLEFFNAQSVQLRASAATRTHALRWERTALLEFLNTHTQALSALRLAARGQHLALELKPDWLVPGEAVAGLARKHPAVLIPAMALPGVLMAGAAAAWLWSGSISAAWLSALGWLLAVVGVALAIWQWVDWRNDYCYVTTRRLVRSEKIVALYDSRQEAPLHQVLSVSVSTTAVSRLLGFGDVVIRTYTGQIEFPAVGQPRFLAALIEEQWRRFKIAEKATDRETVEQAVRQVLSPADIRPDAAPSLDASAPKPTATDPERAPELGLDHWGFQLRFESQGVVTYRKHWAVLLRHIGFPSLVLLLAVGIAGASLGGLITLGSATLVLELAGLSLIPLGLWWLYEYMDWVNDIYQVTPTHIIDVYKRPLGRELRKVAPLENLLSTEVDRRGLIGILLNFGDVSANVGTEVLDFEGVFNPGAVQQDIVRAQEAFIAGRREAERQQREAEMVEWLSVYHEQVSGRKTDKPPQRDPDDYP